MYSFVPSGSRVMESANFCFFDQPCMHPTRSMYFHVYSRPGDGVPATEAQNGCVTLKNLVNAAAAPNIRLLFEKSSGPGISPKSARHT